jgi:mRNA interferase MazF
MRRSEIWWAAFPEPVGRRPVVLVSRDLAYSIRKNVTVAEVTTRVRNVDTEVALGPRDGLPRRCVANADNLHTVSKTILQSRIGVLTAEKTRALYDALALSLGLPRP